MQLFEVPYQALRPRLAVFAMTQLEDVPHEKEYFAVRRLGGRPTGSSPLRRAIGTDDALVGST
jgi:hypothetical protein